MRSPCILVGIILIALNSFSQSIPTAETIFSIHQKEKQQFEFYLQKGFTLKALVVQMGIDLSISVYKKGDTVRLAYFDSPNGENGPEPVLFDGPDSGKYMLVVEPLKEDTASSGKYSIRQISIGLIQAKHDTSFAAGSEITLGEMTPLKIENLTNLGMTSGFSKYHHPAIARGDYNWGRPSHSGSCRKSYRLQQRMLQILNWKNGLTPQETGCLFKMQSFKTG